MNRFWVIVLIVLGAGAGLCTLDGPSEQGRVSSAASADDTGDTDDRWRLTVSGWERNTNWFVTPQRDSPAPHPLAVALFQLLLSVFALMLLPARIGASHSPTTGRGGSSAAVSWRPRRFDNS